MESIEKSPMPEICKSCSELDCTQCNYALDRWTLREKDHLTSLRTLKEKAILRYQREIEAIDKRLAELDAGK